MCAHLEQRGRLALGSSRGGLLHVLSPLGAPGSHVLVTCRHLQNIVHPISYIYSEPFCIVVDLVTGIASQVDYRGIIRRDLV